jgi:hypothetical protein
MLSTQKRHRVAASLPSSATATGHTDAVCRACAFHARSVRRDRHSRVTRPAGACACAAIGKAEAWPPRGEAFQRRQHSCSRRRRLDRPAACACPHPHAARLPRPGTRIRRRATTAARQADGGRARRTREDPACRRRSRPRRGLTKSPLTIRGRPTAAISTSARAHTSRGRACASGRWSPSRSARAAAGPSACRTGSSARRRPPRRPPARTPVSASSSITPSGVHGRSPARPSDSSPALTGVRPSTSLLGSISAGQRRPVEVLGQRQLQQHAADRGSAFRLLELRRRPPRRDASAGSGGRTAPSRPRAQARCLPPTYTAEAGSSPTSTVARPRRRPSALR